MLCTELFIEEPLILYYSPIFAKIWGIIQFVINRHVLKIVNQYV